MQNPPLFIPLPTPEEMSRWDKGAESLYGIPPLLLMENAAQAAVAVLGKYLCLDQSRNILVFAGKGNNGGDGVALARILHDEGHSVRIVLAGPPDALPSPAREHAAMAMSLGLSFLFPDEQGVLPDLGGVNKARANREDATIPDFIPDAVVDAITGTGIKGNLRERELALVRGINRYCGKAFVLSLDIPSGLNGLTGKAMPEAVRADATVCFEAGKPGLHMPGSREHTGDLHIRRVGMPLELRRRFPASWRLLCPKKGAWARPSPLSHKGSAGKVLIVGGSEGMAGAPVLAAMGNLRSGSGLVHVALPGALEAAARAVCPEALVTPVGTGMRWRREDAGVIQDLLHRLKPGCLVMGPGMGRDDEVGELLQAVLEMPDRPPLLLDADALYFLGMPDGGEPAQKKSPTVERAPYLCSLLRAKDILTPHPGEMSRILSLAFYTERGLSTENAADTAARIEIVQENRADALQSFTAACPAVLVLKGAGSLIGRSGDPVALSPFSVAALGVGGSGDVLSGVCAGLVASGMDSLDAACFGVYLHGRAGELLAERTSRGHLAREIADAVPFAWEELCRD